MKSHQQPSQELVSKAVAIQRVSQSASGQQNNQVVAQRKLQQQISSSPRAVAQQKKSSAISSSTGVIQRKGEIKAILATQSHTANGVTYPSMRRGNRRASIDSTAGESLVKVKAFRDKLQELRNRVEQALMSQGHNYNQVSTWFNHNYFRIEGYAAQLVGAGNCGEFASAVYGELLNNTAGQYVARCRMEPIDDYDHGFVLTLDKPVRANQTLDKSVDKQKTMVADGWDGYKVMDLGAFLRKRNAYKDNITIDNIWVMQCEEAQGVDELAQRNIKGIVETFARDFNQWFTTQIADGTSGYNKMLMQYQTDPGSFRRIFGTEGSQSAPLQDMRSIVSMIADPDVSMQSLLLDSTIIDSNKKALAKKWWDGHRNDALYSLNPEAKKAFVIFAEGSGLNIVELYVSNKQKAEGYIALLDSPKQKEKYEQITAHLSSLINHRRNWLSQNGGHQ